MIDAQVLEINVHILVVEKLMINILRGEIIGIQDIKVIEEVPAAATEHHFVMIEDNYIKMKNQVVTENAVLQEENIQMAIKQETKKISVKAVILVQAVGQAIQDQVNQEVRALKKIKAKTEKDLNQ